MRRFSDWLTFSNILIGIRWFDGYTRQYLDVLNCRFIDMVPEKWLKSIPTMAKRLAEQMTLKERMPYITVLCSKAAANSRNNKDSKIMERALEI